MWINHTIRFCLIIMVCHLTSQVKAQDDYDDYEEQEDYSNRRLQGGNGTNLPSLYDACLTGFGMFCMGVKNGVMVYVSETGCLLAKDCDAFISADLGRPVGDTRPVTQLAWTIHANAIRVVTASFFISNESYVSFQNWAPDRHMYLHSTQYSGIFLNNVLITFEEGKEGANAYRYNSSGSQDGYNWVHFSSQIVIFTPQATLLKDYRVDVIKEALYPHLMVSIKQGTIVAAVTPVRVDIFSKGETPLGPPVTTTVKPPTTPAPRTTARTLAPETPAPLTTKETTLAAAAAVAEKPFPWWIIVVVVVLLLLGLMVVFLLTKKKPKTQIEEIVTMSSGPGKSKGKSMSMAPLVKSGIDDERSAYSEGTSMIDNRAADSGIDMEPEVSALSSKSSLKGSNRDGLGLRSQYSSEGRSKGSQIDLGLRSQFSSEGRSKSSQDDLGLRSSYSSEGKSKSSLGDLGLRSSYSSTGKSKMSQDDVSSHGSNSDA